MPPEKKKLKVFDIICLAFTALFSIELVAGQASIGPSVIVWLLTFGVIYLLCHGLICAELGSTYPDQGGNYVWIERAYGHKWASRMTWWCWTNLVAFVPSVFVAMVIVLQQIFDLDISSMDIMFISIIGIWVIVAMNCVSIRDSKIVSNIGAVFKVIFCVALIGGGAWIVFTQGSQTEFTMDTVFPPLDIAAFGLVGTLIYGMTGFDLPSANAGQMDNPKKDVPRALLLTGVVCIVLYLLSDLAVMWVLPLEGIDPAYGMIDAIIAIYGASQAAVVIIGAMLAFIYISYIFSWTIGGNAAALEAGSDGDLPGFYAKTNKFKAPVGAAILMGLGATALILVYGFTADSNENLFWTLLAFTSITFFPPYFLISFALFKLRKSDPNAERPFKIPGKVFPYVVGAVNVICLSIATIAYLVPPEGEDPVSYTLFMVAGVLVVLVLGEIIAAGSEKRRAKIEAAGTAE